MEACIRWYFFRLKYSKYDDRLSQVKKQSFYYANSHEILCLPKNKTFMVSPIWLALWLYFYGQIIHGNASESMVC